MGYAYDNVRLEKGMYRQAGQSFTQVLEREGLEPLELECKEGLSMLNGTISVTAFGLLASYDSILAAKNAEIAGGLCYEALRGTPKALDERIHAAKAHPEQQQAAQCQLQPQGMGAEGDDIGGHQKPQAGPWVKDAPLHLRQGLPFQSACGTWPGR